MAGSKVTTTTPDEMRAAIQRGESRTDLKKVRAQTPYVWDGTNDDDRPLTAEEMEVGIAADRRRRGRPAGGRKTSTTIRLDREIVAAFRASGPGWQTRMNAAWRDWLETHSPG